MSGSAGTLTRLPYEQRRHQLQYTDEEGTVCETACPINFNEVYNLKGRLLTLADATFADQQQRKAFKDLVWVTLRDWFEDIERNATWQPNDGDDTDRSVKNAYLANHKP